MNSLYQQHSAAETHADSFKSHLIALLSIYDRGPISEAQVPTFEGPTDPQRETILRSIDSMARRMWTAEEIIKNGSIKANDQVEVERMLPKDDAVESPHGVPTSHTITTDFEGELRAKEELKLLKQQLGDVARVCNAVARGDLSQKITVPVQGVVMVQLKDVINTMVDKLGQFPKEIIRVCHEIGSEGKLDGQALVLDEEDKPSVTEGAANQYQTRPNQILGKTSEFLFKMAHVVCDPLLNIIGLSESVLETDLNRAQRENILLAHSLARSLLLILDDVMDLSKIENGLILEAMPYSVRQAVFDTLKTYVNRACGNNVSLTYEVDPAMPDLFVGDFRRLKQVIGKLVSNAIKYNRSGSSPGYVAVSVRVAEVHYESVTLEFCVADSGIGIERDELEGIFDHIGNEKNGEYGGIGLSLFLSKRLVSLMRGNMWVESEVSKGSKFFFSIKSSIAPSTAQEVHGGMEPFSKRRVIFVDTLHDQTGVVDCIKELGLEPLVLHNVSDLADTQNYSYTSAILLDSVAEIDSMKKFEHVRYHPIVLIAPVIPKLDMKWCMDNGISCHLTTPIAAQGLSNALMPIFESWNPSWQAPPASDVTFNILLSEDNRVTQKLALKILEKHGHVVEVVETGHKVVDAFKARVSQGKPFDIVLMSLSTPNMGAFEATTLIRQYELDQGHTPETLIIAMAAYATEHYKEKISEDPNSTVPDVKVRCLQTGMNDYITKPLRRGDLLRAINKLKKEPATTPATHRVQ